MKDTPNGNGFVDMMTAIVMILCLSYGLFRVIYPIIHH